jgi:hypothetical protein
MLVATAYDTKGNSKLITKVFTYIEATSIKKILSVKSILDELEQKMVHFYHYNCWTKIRRL